MRVTFYKLVDPKFPDVVRYIGQSGNMRNRRISHRCLTPGTYGLVVCWKRLLIWSGRRPVLTEIDEVEFPDGSGKRGPEAHEWRAIQHYGESHPLLNHRWLMSAAARRGEAVVLSRYIEVMRALCLQHNPPLPELAYRAAVEFEAEYPSTCNVLQLSEITPITGDVKCRIYLRQRLPLRKNVPQASLRRVVQKLRVPPPKSNGKEKQPSNAGTP